MAPPRPPAEVTAMTAAATDRRVFGEGLAPSEEGLVESQPILGSIK